MSHLLNVTVTNSKTEQIKAWNAMIRVKCCMFSLIFLSHFKAVSNDRLWRMILRNKIWFHSIIVIIIEEYNIKIFDGVCGSIFCVKSHTRNQTATASDSLNHYSIFIIIYSFIIWTNQNISLIFCRYCK